MLVHNLKSLIKISKVTYITRNLCQNCGIRNYCGSSSSRIYYKNLLDDSIKRLHQKQLLVRQPTAGGGNASSGPRRNIKITPRARNEVENKRIEEMRGDKKDIKVKFKKKDIKRLLFLAKDEKWTIAAAIGCLIISSGITMAVPYALGKILDTIYSNTEKMENAKERLKTFCLGLCGIFIIGGLANFGRVYLFNSASLQIVKDLRSSLYSRMLNQEVGWFDTKGTGELINRLSSDTYMVGNSLSQNLSDGLRSSVMVLAGTGMMLHTSADLAFIGMAVVPCVAGLAIVYGRFVRNITQQLLDRFAQIMKNGEERLGNVKTVKIFCKEQQESLKYTDLLMDALSLGYKDVRARATFYGLTGFSGNVIIVSVLYFGGSLVASNELTVGALTSFILYAGYTAISLGGLSSFYTNLNKGVGSAARIWEIFDRKYEIPYDIGIVPADLPKGEIVFDNVAFTYPSRPNSQILNNFTLHINPGTVTAVVGRSGSGKTTIASLLLRLYDPQQGRIFLDGIDLKDLNPTYLRRNIGAVNQEPVLFSGTIRENILYGLNPGANISEDQFNKICNEAYVTEFVENLPDGMETIVGQRGIMLSGGQKQRVAIARALIKNPSILVLDEATSALDAVSEELIRNALDNLTKNRTVLTIAHRLSTIRNAQSIVVLDHGNVAEQGRYEDLMTIEDGIFKQLVKYQTFNKTK